MRFEKRCIRQKSIYLAYKWRIFNLSAQKIRAIGGISSSEINEFILIVDSADKLLYAAQFFLELKTLVVGDERESGSLEDTKCRILNAVCGEKRGPGDGEAEGRAHGPWGRA